MDNLKPKKLAILFILQILEKYSDESHPLTQEDIARYLSKDYSIEIERKAIGRNISLLKEAGFEIEFTNKMGSYLCREFEDSELRLLIDGIRFSKYIKKSYSDDIVNRLLDMGTPSLRERMSAVKYVSGNSEIKESQLFLRIDDLSAAISEKKKVAFRYLEYDVNKELSPVWGEKIIVTPKELVATNGNYYLIGLIDGNTQYTNFRLEKIRDITILGDSADTSAKFDLKEYLSTHPLMYCGEPITATLRVSIIIMGDVVDFFGTNFITIQKREIDGNELTDYIEIVVRTNEWDIMDFALRNAFFVEVLSPDNIRLKLKREAQSLIGKYK